MERYLNIAKVNFKFNLFPHIIVAVCLCLITPLIMGVKNLDSIKTARILDMYISILGIILLVPIFIPEQDKDIRDLTVSKKQSMFSNYLIRIIQAMIFLTIIIMAFLVYLKSGNCTFDFSKYLYGTISTCIFIGGLGILVYSLVDNIAVGYMVPLLYYTLCIGSGKKYLGEFYLFSMMKGDISDKKYLLVSGVVMIMIGILYRSKGIKYK